MFLSSASSSCWELPHHRIALPGAAIGAACIPIAREPRLTLLPAAFEFPYGQRQCRDRCCFGFPEEPSFQSVAVCCRRRRGVAGPANDSCIGGRCPDQTDAPTGWLQLIDGELDRRVDERTTGKCSGASR